MSSSAKVENNAVNGGTGSPTVLRETLDLVSQECPSRLGISANEVQAKSLTVDVFFDAIAAERLRRMPPDGSRLDGALCRASRLAFAVGSLRDSVNGFLDGTDEAAKMIWGATLLLLEIGMDRIETLDSIFGQYGRVTMGISLLLQQESYFRSSRSLQQEVAEIFAHLLQMIMHISMEYRQGVRNQNWQAVGEAVNGSFFCYFNRFTVHWRRISQAAFSTGVANKTVADFASIYQFLELQDRPLQMLLDGHNHSLTDGSFAWFDPHLTTFTLSRRNLMLVTGHPGSGKSALAQWTVGKLQGSPEFDIWSVVPVAIRSDVPITTLTLSILKNILIQMLDHCVSSRETQDLILPAVTKALELAETGAADPQVEEQLWVALRTALQSNLQFLLVVDGIDQIKHPNATVGSFLHRLQEAVSERNSPSKLITFSRPLAKAQMPMRETTTTHQLTMNASLTEHDLQGAVEDTMASDSAFSGLDTLQTRALSTSIVPRAQGCFVWAQLALELARHQSTFPEMVSAIKNAPKTLGDVIDRHLQGINLHRMGIQSVLAWLTASERPFRVQELEHLLAVDVKSLKVATRTPNIDRDILQPLTRITLVRDGFVSFRHPMIREHIQARAIMSQVVPFTLAEAHYDLLIRSLAWVRQSVSDEVAVAWDKLGVSARDRYMDAYELLEYTSRYWLSHMLSSPIAMSNRELSFTGPFRRAMPTSVIFAQLELTNRESQFSRSSIVELYRLSVVVRRGVLGDDSHALLQSLILSARAADQAKATWANDHLFEAWTRSRALYGPTDTISQSLEQLLVSTPEGKGKADRSAGLKTEALRDMTLANWGSSDITFAQRLQYLDRLVNHYKGKNQKELAYDVSKQFYRQTLQTYGLYSSETMQAAQFLEHHFTIKPPDELALELTRAKYENTVRSMDVTDPRRIAEGLRLAQMYEESNQAVKAEGVLTRLWSALSAREIDSINSWDQRTKVAFYFSQFLRRQSRPDESTALLRELSAELEEDGGVKSPEMVERAEELRVEAREMGLVDMDRALALQVWKYYYTTGQQYSPEAVQLAEGLANDLIPTKAMVESTGILSPEETILLPGLIDSIASAGTNQRTLPLLGLCHHLATQHIRAEEWSEGSKSALAVLKHAWPTVEDPQSTAKFHSNEAPTMANLALDHAYCLFRRLHVHTASVVYGNAFKASITADQVAVPSVTTVVKTVVEFYETTFQFEKALVLLHQVSDFFASRLGQHDKHTIDTRYYEGDLALRLSRRSEAEDSYHNIYTACIRDGKISSSGVRASVALVALYEQQQKWDAALEVYRHLWPTLVRFDERDGYDRALLEGLLPKTYAGYMAILDHSTIQGAGAERHQVASQHQQLCRKLYGATNPRTRDATLTLAALCANSARHTEAVNLYQQVLNTNDWVSASEVSRGLPDMSEPLPISIKHQMAQLYIQQNNTSRDAYSLYNEELALAKQQQGLSAPNTLLWLHAIANMHAKQGSVESRKQGAALLREHVDEVVHVTTNHDTLVDRAHRLAEIYLECGYIEEGNQMINDMRQQVVHETPAAQRQSLVEYRPAVFVASFEEVFGKRQTSHQILSELSREGQVYNAFQQSLASHDLVPTLAAGDKLHRLQVDQKRAAAAQSTHDRLYEYFCNSLSVASQQRKNDSVHQFYNVCWRESTHSDYNINVVTSTATMVRDLCNRSQFQDAAYVTGVFHSFVHLTEGLQTPESIFTAIKICLYLNGYKTNKCSDDTISANMALESQMLLQEIMSNAKDQPIEFSELPFSELNDLVTVLGEHEMFEDLEAILTDLWTSRVVQKTWSLPVVVWIGRRLVETRFCRGQVASATQLGKDICYNLRQVWGNCDTVTLEMNKLLSGLYTASGNHLAAAALHEAALAELLNSDETHAESVDAVTQHLELLQHAQARLSKDGQSGAVDATAAEERVQQIATKFGLSTSQLEAAEADESLGMWQRPRRFSLDVEEPTTHQNHLRQSSGSALLNGNAGAKRISISAL
ncbi:uncharacterized protein LDX57_009626 [Aspergillus melleus]|uniref:uncharacterized protein n=1 Tax=Aspergillus melleus TaxID=138277 RepID=UPI001E8E329A|nr:uncharacterized protein LDX57_009626 [Aspergillus melleus]KAH8431979.1 hypothetical protein LDX57_009626 [Aspergillus melleus]